MKRYLGWLILIYLLLVIGLIILSQTTANGQTQFRIFKIDTAIKQRVFCRGREMKSGNLARIEISFRGAGKKPELMNVWVTYYPEGLPRRRHVHWKVNP